MFPGKVWVDRSGDDRRSGSTGWDNEWEEKRKRKEYMNRVLRFLAVMIGLAGMASGLGLTWTNQVAANASNWVGVAYGNNVFVAVSVTGNLGQVMTSPDGVTWTARTAATYAYWRSVAFGNGVFVAVSTNGVAMTSSDGITWALQTLVNGAQWRSVAFGGGLFVAVSSNGTERVITSPDGITWTSQITPVPAVGWRSVTYGNGRYVAVGTGGVMTSPDGFVWTSYTSVDSDNADWRSVAFGNGRFVAVNLDGWHNIAISSVNGLNWTTIATPAASDSWLGVTYGDGKFVAISYGPTNGVMTSPDGLTWTGNNAADGNTWSAVTYANGLFVAVGDGLVKTSGTFVASGPATAPLPLSLPLQISSLGPINLTVVPNQSLLGTGTVTVVANESGTWTATTSTGWLSLTQSAGGFPGVVAATANAAGLAAGSYTGSISVSGVGGGGTQTISIPVSLTVSALALVTANPTSISMASGYPAGSATGYTIQTGAAGVAFTVATSASSAGWLRISPASGIAPTPITVTLDPSQATPGSYADSIVISSPGVASVTVPVKMSVSGLFATLPQQVNATGVAGPDHTVAPNEIVSLYLTDFSCATAPVVSINGTAVSWSSYAAGQINYVVPERMTSPAALTVACNGNAAWSFNGLTTAAVVPGIFTLTGTGKGQAAIINADGTVNGSTNPATRGSWLSVYGTGFGLFNAAGTNGLRTVAGTVTASIGGTDATVIYAGNTPGATEGLQQFNLQIPAGVTAGTAVPIVLTVNGTSTQTTATVALK